MMYCVAAVVVAYFLGSISFAVIFTKLFAKTDVRHHGSGNAGATNVLRVAGVLPGILTFVLDAVKGFVSSYIGKIMFANAFPENANAAIYGAYLCGIVCMIGHSYPLFFAFKGGKCAATSVGIFLCCCPSAIGLGLIAFVISVLISGIVSLSTLITAVVTVTVSAVKNINLPFVVALSIIAGIIVFLRHGENIKRLINGTEKRLKIKK